MNWEEYQGIRKKIFDSLPKDAFEENPSMLIWGLCYALIIGTSSIILYRDNIGIITSLVLSLIIGICYGCWTFLAHDVLHGSVVRSKILQNLIGYPGFSIYFMSSYVWKAWHNRLHHPETNKNGIDPDMFGLEDTFFNYPMAKVLYRQAPGSRKIDSLFLSFTSRFTNQSFNVLWYFAFKNPKIFKGMTLWRGVLETLLIYSLWGLLINFLGWKNSLFILFIPMMIANTTVMAYIYTQHLMCPMTDQNIPLINTTSVKTLPLIDFLHHNFSYHVEHHMFPTLNAKYLPYVSKKLVELCPEHYRRLSHWAALKLLFKTPRVYKDAHTLIDPYTREELDVRTLFKS